MAKTIANVLGLRPIPTGKTTIIGIEVEVEKIYNPIGDQVVWMEKGDNSLRNCGREYVSHPIPYKKAKIHLTSLLYALFRDNAPEFTDRTSIHIHVNVQDLSVEELKSFVLLYICFENLFYRYAGGNRFNSIYCVPLIHAGYIKQIQNLFSMRDDKYSLALVYKYWHKYTGCNLHSIGTYGTVEFRHLYGTSNVDEIVNWINLIIKVKEKSKNKTLAEWFSIISELNTNSEYENFAMSIFEEKFPKIPCTSIQEDMEPTVSYIKHCFVRKELAIDDYFEDSLFFSALNIKKHILSEEEKIEKSLTDLRNRYYENINPEERREIERLYVEQEAILRGIRNRNIAPNVVFDEVQGEF